MIPIFIGCPSRISVAAKDVAARALDDGEGRALVVAFGMEMGGMPAITRGRGTAMSIQVGA